MVSDGFEAVNNVSASSESRLAALASFATNAQFPDFSEVESNNHIHTCYSFSPYTPAGAALRARQAGLPVVGSVDHDSLGAAAEMRGACATLGMGAVTGFEIRAWAYTPQQVADGQAPLQNRKFNNPDSAGVAYMTVQGVPARSRALVADFLAPVRARRLERTRLMAEAACQILDKAGVAPFDFDADVVGASYYNQGGEVTERHLLAAMARALIGHFGPGVGLVDGLETLGLTLPSALRQSLSDAVEPYLTYDLLGVLKAEYLDRFYLQPTHFSQGGECYDAKTVVDFALSIGAVPAYAYLGDVAQSPTGDKKAEHFEDAFLDELFAYLAEVGFPAVTYMPPRNTPTQIERIRHLANTWGLLEISGVDINQPRQSFNCPELSRPELSHLTEATWALVAHEVLADLDPALALFAPQGPVSSLPLPARVAAFARAGRQLRAGADPHQVGASLGALSLPGGP